MNSVVIGFLQHFTRYPGTPTLSFCHGLEIERFGAVRTGAFLRKCVQKLLFIGDFNWMESGVPGTLRLLG